MLQKNWRLKKQLSQRYCSYTRKIFQVCMLCLIIITFRVIIEVLLFLEIIDLKEYYFFSSIILATIIISIFAILKSKISATETFLDTINTVVPLECTTDDTSVKQGTAILIKNGILLTNAQFLFDDKGNLYKKFTCSFLEKNRYFYQFYSATIIKYDLSSDIAFLSLNAPIKLQKGLGYVKSGTIRRLHTGSPIFIIGNFAGNGIGIVQETLTNPLVKISNLDIITDYFMQIKIKTKNGGAVLDKKGNLVGMITLIKNNDKYFSYAIPIDKIWEYLQQ